MSALLRAPRVRLSWTATALGDPYFKAYRIYRRPATTPAQPWRMIAEISVPTGYDASDVEAQHTYFDDYMAGWYNASGEFANGWDYVVTSVDSANAEATIDPASVTARRVTVTDPGTPWLTSNAVPYLNCPVKILQDVGSEIPSRQLVRNYAGRDHSVVITPSERPGRSVSASVQYLNTTGPFALTQLRNVMNSGQEFALLRPLGDRIVGAVTVGGFADAHRERQVASLTVTETDDSSVAQYNLPAGIVLDGTNDYLITPDAVHLDPASSAFSVVMAAKFSSTASKYALSKGNGGTAAGYFLRTTGNANELQFFVHGASTSGGPVATSADWFSDVSVAVGTSSGTAQVLYKNGVSAGTSSVTHGAVANAIALVAGGNNAGASAWSALAPLRGYAVYMRELSATEALNASYYFLGYPGYRLPAGAVFCVDLRDDRVWKGTGTTLHDLSDYNNTVTSTGGGVARGIPWPLSRYETL